MELAIYSVDGRRVKLLANGAHEPSLFRLSWNGTDDSGPSVSPGMYCARLMTPEGHFTRTLVMVK